MNKTNKRLRGVLTMSTLGALTLASLITGSLIYAGKSKTTLPGCNCEIAQSSTSLQHFELSQGQSASLISLANLPPGGTWESQLGKITASGVYTAPSFFSTGLSDEIQYWVNGAAIYTTKILIKRDPGMPVQGAQPVTRSLAPDNETLIFTSPLPNDDFWHEVIDPGHIDEPTPTPTLCEAIIAEALSTSNDKQVVGTAVQTQNGDLQMNGIGVQGTTLQLQQAKKCAVKGPLYPGKKPTGPCTPGTTRKEYGPVHEFVKLGPWMDNGELTVSAEMAAEIKKIFNITITIGAKIQIKSRAVDYKQIQHGDKYVCGADGQWAYAGSFTCTRTGLGVETIPSYGSIILGFPANGNPHHWTPWSCTPL
jgi:hypothetical protein